jgi:hypothetical protein
MQRPMQGPPDDHLPDFSGTDTIPLPILRAEDTGRVEAPDLPEEDEAEVPVRIRPRVTVQDPLTRTDTFQARSLAPLAAVKPVDTSDLADTLRQHEQQLERSRQRIAALESQLAEAQRRCIELESELAESGRRIEELMAGRDAARAEAEAAIAAARAAEEARAAAEARARESARAAAASAAQQESPPLPADLRSAQRELTVLRRENQRLHESLSTVQARIGVHEALLFEAEEALRAARAGGPAQAPATGDAPASPGADAHREGTLRIDWQARFIELEKMLEAERAAASARAREYEQRVAGLEQALEAERSRQRGAPAAHKSLPIGTVLRVLVREEDGTEFVYPLGRHTTVGRTADNDIQVNTTFVSRHHAVLLTSNEHCIVEDLNSTNGILVNGQRVNRALLHHGDALTIGRTNFRYEVRQ